ncbi:hypothetical protein LPJ76_002299 [Coemansia sp. RSA 638]|nr:hypothetical protein LPJ76_002299 [Coemansia sp. RSA 638]
MPAFYLRKPKLKEAICNTMQTSNVLASNLDSMSIDILPSITLLFVLNILVVTYPQEMSELLSNKTNASRLLALVNFNTIPIDLRMVVVTMASRWCILLDSCPLAKSNMSLLVDSFYYNTGNLPSHKFLTKLPKDTQLQPNWKYPPMTPVTGDMSYFYIPAKAAVRSTRASKPTQPHSVKPRNAEYSLEHIETSAQKLQSLSEILTVNLGMARSNNDPQTDSMIKDIVEQINTELSTVLKHTCTLNTVSTKLHEAANEAKRSLALYNSTIECQEDWANGRNKFGLARAPKQSKYTRTADSPVLGSKANSSGFSLGSTVCQGESFKPTMLRTTGSSTPRQVSNSSSDYSNSSRGRQPGLVHMSEKAKGKMPAQL